MSHRLDEVLRICDRIIVMRSGEVVADRATEAVTEDELFQLMIGHAARRDQERGRRTGRRSEPLLQVSGLTRKGEYKTWTSPCRPGHCVAIVGTIGSGRE